MSLEYLKSAISLNLQELFATATVDELTGDMEAYRAKMETVAAIAKMLGLKAEITKVTIDFTADDAASV